MNLLEKQLTRSDFNRWFPWIIYALALVMYLFLLYRIRHYGLLPFPTEGTDQLSILRGAVQLYQGKPLPHGYVYSPLYTYFLSILIALSGGNLVIIRLLQAIVCAGAPVLVFKLARSMRFSFDTSELAALLYLFYGPAALLSLEFLRAVPLTMCFLLTMLFLVRGFYGRNLTYYLLAGIFAAFSILGRDNFLPIVFVPVVMIVFKSVRRYLTARRILAYLLPLMLIIAPLIAFNLVKYRSFTVRPNLFTRTLKDSLLVRDKKPVGKVIFEKLLHELPGRSVKVLSNYELPHSLSFYAHREIVGFMWIFWLPFNLIAALGIASLLVKYRSQGVWLLLILSGTYLGTILPFGPYTRYRFPAFPLLLIPASALTVYLFQCKNAVKIIIPLAVAGAIFWITWISPDSLRPAGERLGVAKVLIQLGEYYRAEAYLERLEKEKLPTENLWILLAKKLQDNGRNQDAMRVIADYLIRKKNAAREGTRPPE